MRVGDLKNRILFQSQTRTSDGMGGATTVWDDECEVWAAIWPVSGAEQVQAMQNVMTITHRIRIRYREGILASWRVKFGTRYFAIVGIVNPNEENKWLEILAKEAA